MPYQIVDWAKYFESAKSKLIRRPTHAYMPNKQHGMGFLCLLREGPVQGLAVFGAWVATVQACSQQENKVRDGWLTDDGTPQGRPWTAEDLAHRFRADPKVCQRMLDVCTSQGWMKYHGRTDLRTLQEPSMATQVSTPGIPQGPPDSDNDLTRKDQKQTSPRRKNKASTGETERANGDGDSGSRKNGKKPGGTRGEQYPAGQQKSGKQLARSGGGAGRRVSKPAGVEGAPASTGASADGPGGHAPGSQPVGTDRRRGAPSRGAAVGQPAGNGAPPVAAVGRDGGRAAEPSEPEAGGLPERQGPLLPADAEPDVGVDAAGEPAAPAGPEAEAVSGGEAGVHEPDAGGGARDDRAAPGGPGADGAGNGKRQEPRTNDPARELSGANPQSEIQNPQSDRACAIRWLILAKALRGNYWTKPHQRYWPDTFLNWARVHHPEPSEERTLADIAAVARTEARKLNRTHRIDNVPAYAVALARNWTPGAFPAEDMNRARMVFEALEQEIVAKGEAPEGLENFTLGNGGGDHAEARQAAVAE